LAHVRQNHLELSNSYTEIIDYIIAKLRYYFIITNSRTNNTGGYFITTI